MSSKTNNEGTDRRSFLSKAVFAIFGLGGLATLWPYVRSLVPNVLYEPPRRFKVGMPNRFQRGVHFLEEHRVYLFRDGNSFHAISGVCTHLGCTVKFVNAKNESEITVRGLTYKSKGEFRCACHGSKFRDEGTNFGGPAPRPLAWHQLEIAADDGQLVVNLSREVQRDFRLVV